MFREFHLKNEAVMKTVNFFTFLAIALIMERPKPSYIDQIILVLVIWESTRQVIDNFTVGCRFILAQKKYKKNKQRNFI